MALAHCTVAPVGSFPYHSNHCSGTFKSGRELRQNTELHFYSAEVEFETEPVPTFFGHEVTR